MQSLKSINQDDPDRDQGALFRICELRNLAISGNYGLSLRWVILKNGRYTRAMRLLFCTISIAAVFAFEARPSLAQDRSCSAFDFQACQTCDELSRVMESEDPNAGDYYRGAEWNALFTAYRLNCTEIGRSLLAHGANPCIGGQYGFMAIALSSDWWHDDLEINWTWAYLLRAYGLSIDCKGKYDDRTPVDVVATETLEIDYPEIWQFLSEEVPTEVKTVDQGFLNAVILTGTTYGTVGDSMTVEQFLGLMHGCTKPYGKSGSNEVKINNLGDGEFHISIEFRSMMQFRFWHVTEGFEFVAAYIDSIYVEQHDGSFAIASSDFDKHYIVTNLIAQCLES